MRSAQLSSNSISAIATKVPQKCRSSKHKFIAEGFLWKFFTIENMHKKLDYCEQSRSFIETLLILSSLSIGTTIKKSLLLFY